MISELTILECFIVSLVLVFHLTKNSHQFSGFFCYWVMKRGTGYCSYEHIYFFLFSQTWRNWAYLSFFIFLLCEFTMKIYERLISILDSHPPRQILNCIFMTTEDITIKINYLVHIFNIFTHLCCISFEKSSNSSNK